jgi:uncharacterized SAM-binding protein YcdF (DUF218 family)
MKARLPPRWLLAVLLFFAGVAGAYAGRRPALTAVGAFLIVSDAPQPSDAIVVLSGSVPDRILEAVDLYEQGWAPRIILTREHPLPGLAELRRRGVELPEHHEHNQRIAEQLGVPRAAMYVIARKAASTFQEAQALLAELRSQKMRRVIVVTSKVHSRRARWIFRDLAGGDPEVLIRASRHDPFTAESWWHGRGYTRRVVIEYGKLLTYLFIDRWRQ